MKKIGLLMLTMVIALGALGIGYAAWTDEINIVGTVDTGSVCFSIEEDTFGEINTCRPSQFATQPDQNWYGWVPLAGNISCPPGYEFDTKPCSDKDVASIEMAPVYDDDGNIVELKVTVHNAYPHFLGHLTYEVCNCGTIPIIINAPIFDQDPNLLIEYRNGTGTQLHVGQCHEVSLFIGVTQHVGYENAQGVWIVDDPNAPLTPQNTDLSFTIQVSAIQWNEYEG